MSNELKLNLDKVGQDIVNQLKNLVPERTGRLKNSIKYRIVEKEDGYVVQIILEDYFAWLKPRTKTPTLPTARELSLARPPLPKMNNLGIKRVQDLSPRAQGIIGRIDLDKSLKLVDSKEIEEQIKELLNI